MQTILQMLDFKNKQISTLQKVNFNISVDDLRAHGETGTRESGKEHDRA